MEEVELKFQYTKKEYVKAWRRYETVSRRYFRSERRKKVSIKRILVSLLCIPILIYISFFPSSITYFFLPSSTYSIILLSFAIVCIEFFYMPAYRFEHTSKYHEEYNLIFSKDGIKFKTPTVNSELKWDVYSGLWESADCYFLVESPKEYTLLPKRAFLNLTTQQTFEEIVLSQLKCTKRVI